MGVTVTYQNAHGTLVTDPPSQGTMLHHNTLVATVAASANGDAAAVITHNMQLSAADIAASWPTVLFTPLSNQYQTSNWFVVSLDPNWVGLQKGNTGGGGAAAEQLKVTVSRPHTIVR